MRQVWYIPDILLHNILAMQQTHIYLPVYIYLLKKSQS